MFVSGSLNSLVWLALGAFATGTEGFMIAGLLPALARDLHVSLSAAGHLVLGASAGALVIVDDGAGRLSWVATAFSVAALLAVPVCGRAAAH